MERAVVLCRAECAGADLFPFASAEAPTDLSLAGAEAVHIRKILALDGWNVARAARDLDIDRVTLYNKIKKYGFEKDRPQG